MIKNGQGEPPLKVFDIDYHCHLAHLFAQKGAKYLSIEAICFILFCCFLLLPFKKSVKKKTTLGDYMVFTNTEVKKITKHATKRWLSLGKSLDSVTIACFRI